jgi:RNA polymerase sigma-70 factor (ECF subfamily)
VFARIPFACPQSFYAFVCPGRRVTGFIPPLGGLFVASSNLSVERSWGRNSFSPVGAGKRAAAINVSDSDVPNRAVQLDDVELLNSMQAGCERSFDELFGRYWKLVFAIAWNITRQRSEAEEVVQDVFLTIYMRSGEYDAARASVRTWIAQFAHFKSLVRRRSMQMSLASLDDLKEFETGLAGAKSDTEGLERAAFVEECLSALEPRQRRAVELVHFDGYTLLETATILKQSLANTRNLYYRGMSALRTKVNVEVKPALTRLAISNRLSDAAADSLIAEGRLSHEA